MARRPTATFHVVTRGNCWLDVDGEVKGLPLAAGDLVILPHGHAHVMRSPLHTPVRRIEPLDDLVARLVPDRTGTLGNGRGERRTTLICGGFALEGMRTNPLLSGLPPYILVKSKTNRLDAWLRATIQWVEAEAQANRAGAETIIGRLSEILFIQAMRAVISTDPNGRMAWLKALDDPQIGQALGLIHGQPTEHWTTVSLAHQLGLSRTAFCSKFKQLVGEAPGRYLRRWRLTQAAAHLRAGRGKLAEIARLVGYDSDVSLSKAFKRHYGVAPGAYRHGA